MRSRRLASLTGRRAALLWVAAAVILAAAFAIRLAYVDATPGMKLVNDALDYDGHAVSIATVGHYSDTLAYGRPTAFRRPATPTRSPRSTRRRASRVRASPAASTSRGACRWSSGRSSSR